MNNFTFDNGIEVIAVIAALFYSRNSFFCLMMAIHVTAFTIFTSILAAELHPLSDPINNMYYYSSVATWLFSLAFLFLIARTRNCVTMFVILIIQSLAACYLTVAGFEIFGVYVPDSDAIYSIHGWLDDSILLTEVTLTWMVAVKSREKQV